MTSKLQHSFEASVYEFQTEIDDNIIIDNLTLECVPATEMPLVKEPGKRKKRRAHAYAIRFIRIATGNHGHTIRFNAKFVAKATEMELKKVIFHELGHLFGHLRHYRAPGIMDIHLETVHNYDWEWLKAQFRRRYHKWK